MKKIFRLFLPFIGREKHIHILATRIFDIALSHFLGSVIEKENVSLHSMAHLVQILSAELTGASAQGSSIKTQVYPF